MAATPLSSPAPGSRRARVASALSVVALGVAALCALAALAAGPGYRAGLWSLGAGFGALRWTTMVALGAGALAFCALLLAALPARFPSRVRVLAQSVAALAVSAAVAGPPLMMFRQAQQVPRIHDITTDTADPPAFVAVVPLRKDARNPADYAPETAALQKQGYPDIAPLKLAVPPAQAFERALAAARAMGWEIVAAAPNELRIEATDTTPMFGFKDDVVVRIRPADGGAVVDVRSKSRIGLSDLGTNAKRVRSYLARVANG